MTRMVNYAPKVAEQEQEVMIHSLIVRASVRPVPMLGHLMSFLSNTYLDNLPTKDYRNILVLGMGMEDDRQHQRTRLVRSMKLERICSRMVKLPHDPLVHPISIFD